MDPRERSKVGPRGTGRARRAPYEPLVYTAQDVAHFCEVDLKTIHNWVARSKIPHRRTEGRHLRFRRNHVVRFLREHGYPIPPELSDVKPALALGPLPGAPLASVEIDKKLASRFVLRRSPSAAVALVRAVADELDGFVFALSDPALGGATTIAALKAAEETSWLAIVAICEDDAIESARLAGADLALGYESVLRLGPEIGRLLAL